MALYYQIYRTALPNTSAIKKKPSFTRFIRIYSKIV